jgi:hypothetical protein
MQRLLAEAVRAVRLPLRRPRLVLLHPRLAWRRLLRRVAAQAERAGNAAGKELVLAPPHQPRERLPLPPAEAGRPHRLCLQPRDCSAR